MPKGIYKRTTKHFKILRKATQTVAKLPRTTVQRTQLEKIQKQPRSPAQIAQSREAVKKAQKVANTLLKTPAQLESLKKGTKAAAKLPRSPAQRAQLKEVQRLHSRNNLNKAIKASFGLNCHHRNGEHEDDNQFNLQVLTHEDHGKIHGQLRNGINCEHLTDYSQVALQVKLSTEMYYGD